jgi:hypothetical protein
MVKKFFPSVVRRLEQFASDEKHEEALDFKALEGCVVCIGTLSISKLPVMPI